MLQKYKKYNTKQREEKKYGKWEIILCGILLGLSLGTLVFTLLNHDDF